jgi:hypothetical protein
MGEAHEGLTPVGGRLSVHGERDIKILVKGVIRRIQICEVLRLLQ